MKPHSPKAYASAPKTTLRRAVFGALAFCLLAAPHGVGEARSQTDGVSEELLDTAQTPVGELMLVRRHEGWVTTIIIKLGGRVLAEKGASRDGYAYASALFDGLYPRAAPRYALVSFMTGALVCGAKFTIVDLSRGAAAARVTEDFGNCSEIPRVSYRRGALTLTFPAGPRKHDTSTYYVGPGQVWSYSDGRLRRIGGRR
jgi:hypothetical protein